MEYMFHWAIVGYTVFTMATGERFSISINSALYRITHPSLIGD